MDAIRALASVGDGACNNADLVLFLTTRMHVWAPSMFAGGLAGAWVYRLSGMQDEWVLLLAAGLGAASGLGLSFYFGSDHEVSKGCREVGHAIEKAVGVFKRKKKSKADKLPAKDG